MSSYQRVTGATDTYVKVTAKICTYSVAIAQKNDHLSFLNWFKSQKPQLIPQSWLKLKKLLHLGRKDRIERLQCTKYIRDILSRAEESSFRTCAPRQTPTSTSSAPSQPSTVSHQSSLASQQTSMIANSTVVYKTCTGSYHPFADVLCPTTDVRMPFLDASFSQPLSLAQTVHV